MSPILISIVVVLVVVLGTAFWMDHRRKRFGDTNSAAAMGKTARQTRLDGRAKGSESGAGL